MIKNRCLVLLLGCLFFLCICKPLIAAEEKPSSTGKKFKVLIVSSYDDDYLWTKEIRDGVEAVLGKSCDLKFFNMQTKKYLAKGPQKAKEAYAIYQSWQPDGIIAADDNAQAMFVVPYLKDQTTIPVMFCGVNSKAEKYGYPTDNITGILEVYPIAQSIILAQSLVPSIRRVAFMLKKSPTAAAVMEQVNNNKNDYPAVVSAFYEPETLDQALAMAKDASTKSDLLFLDALQGLKDKNGKPLHEEETIPQIVKAFNKPTTGSNSFHVYHGVLCSVVKRGQEQGSTAAKMLLKALQGTAVKNIPMTTNQFGQRIVNVDTMKALAIRPKPSVIRSVMLIKTKKK